jgi:glycosyltransferase involved in cell wall biosynthesis
MPPFVELVIPAHDEANRLPMTLARLRAHLHTSPRPLGWLQVLVVDNASTDDTRKLAEEFDAPGMPVRVVSCLVRGKGAAVCFGVSHTTAPVVGFMDADGATDLSALPEALRLLEAGADIAIASRAVPGSVTNERHSSARVQGARFYRRATRTIAPGIHDTQCGFKLFRGDLARELFSQVRCRGFSFDVEVLARAQRAGAAIAEFPTMWYDVPGSTFHPFRHGAPAFWELAVMARRLHVERAGDVAGDPVAPFTVTLPRAVDG